MASPEPKKKALPGGSHLEGGAKLNAQGKCAHDFQEDTGLRTPRDRGGHSKAAEATEVLNRIGIQAFAEQRLHHIEGGYGNPFNPTQRRGLWPFLKWRIFSANSYRAQYAREVVRPVDLNGGRLATVSRPTITYISHASVLISDGGRSLLLDPVFNGLSAFLKDYTPLSQLPAQLKRPDVVLVTHGHYDHLDSASLSLLDPSVGVVAPLGYGAHFAKLGLNNHTALDWFDTRAVKGWRVTCLPANHWTMRNPLIGPNRSLWGGFSVTTPSGYRIYLSGDTAFFNGFEQIGNLHPFDLAVFNLGAYEPRWFMRHSHLNPAECVTAFEQLGARWLMPIHWGSFRLGDEPIFLPPEELKAQMTAKGLAAQLLVLQHGASWELA